MLLQFTAGAIAHQNNLPQEECGGGDDDGDGDEGYDDDDDDGGDDGDDRDDDDGDGGDDGDDRDDDGGGGDDDGDGGGGPVEAAGLVCGGMPQLDGVRLVLLCGGVLGGEEGTDDSREGTDDSRDKVVMHTFCVCVMGCNVNLKFYL